MESLNPENLLKLQFVGDLLAVLLQAYKIFYALAKIVF